MEIANSRSTRRKRTTSPDERVEKIMGEMPGIFQPLPGSPGRLTKTRQRKQQAAKLNALRQARRTTAVGSCSSTPPSRDSIEFGSPLSFQNLMASQSERQQHLSPGAWTKAQERKQKRAQVIAMNRARRSSPPPRLPILPCKLDESGETDDAAESTSISESSEPESTSASSANDASSEEAVDDDDPEGEDDEDDERDDEAGYDDDEEDEVSGACSEEEAGGEDIENVSYRFDHTKFCAHSAPPPPTPTPMQTSKLFVYVSERR